MPILFFIFFKLYVNKNLTPLSLKCEKKPKVSAFKVNLHLSSQKSFQYFETSCLGTQKIYPCLLRISN